MEGVKGIFAGGAIGHGGLTSAANDAAGGAIWWRWSRFAVECCPHHWAGEPYRWAAYSMGIQEDTSEHDYT